MNMSSSINQILIPQESEYYCMKSIQIRSYFWSVFSSIRTEYGEILSLRIQSEHRKIRTRNNSVFGHFSRSASWLTEIELTNKVNLVHQFCLK